MKQTTLRKVKKGEYFTLTNEVKYDEDGDVLRKYVYVRDWYSRKSKKYIVYKFSNVCDWREMRGDSIVYIDFRF